MCAHVCAHVRASVCVWVCLPASNPPLPLHARLPARRNVFPTPIRPAKCAFPTPVRPAKCAFPRRLVVAAVIVLVIWCHGEKTKTGFAGNKEITHFKLCRSLTLPLSPPTAPVHSAGPTHNSPAATFVIFISLGTGRAGATKTYAPLPLDRLCNKSAQHKAYCRAVGILRPAYIGALPLCFRWPRRNIYRGRQTWQRRRSCIEKYNVCGPGASGRPTLERTCRSNFA